MMILGTAAEATISRGKMLICEKLGDVFTVKARSVEANRKVCSCRENSDRRLKKDDDAEEPRDDRVTTGD